MSKYNKASRDRRLAAGLCVGCGKVKPVENKKECEKCRCKRSKRQKEEYHRRKDELRETKKIKRELFKEQGLCYNCGKNTKEGKLRCKSCIDTQKKRANLLKDTCYNHYGGYKCNCCGECIKEFLVLDHINNDGASHRKKMKHKSDGFGSHLHRWIVKNNFPPIFQVLCANCNTGKQLNGGVCPHKSLSSESLLQSNL